MALETYSFVRCDGCGRHASEALFSDGAAAKIADMRGYKVDAAGNWLCRDCQQCPPIPIVLTVPGCRIVS